MYVSITLDLKGLNFFFGFHRILKNFSSAMIGAPWSHTYWLPGGLDPGPATTRRLREVRKDNFTGRPRSLVRNIFRSVGVFLQYTIMYGWAKRFFAGRERKKSNKKEKGQSNGDNIIVLQNAGAGIRFAWYRKRRGFLSLLATVVNIVTASLNPPRGVLREASVIYAR